MRRKGITIWEQHLERFVLAAAALFFVGFTAFQFLSEPNVVESGAEKARPAGIDAKLREQAEQIDIALKREARLEAPGHDPLSDVFVARLNDPVSPVDDLQFPLRLENVGQATGVAHDVAYVLPEIPGPQPSKTRQWFDAIDPATVTTYPELQERFQQEPYDATWITVSAIFPLEETRQQFRKQGGEGEASIPPMWYFDRVDILDVKVEREEYIDGEWSNRTTLPPLPTQPSLREVFEDIALRPASNATVGDRNVVLARLAEPGVRVGIVQPEFLPTANEWWEQPELEEEQEEQEPDEGLDEAQQRISDWQRKLDDQLAKRERVLKQLDELGAPPSDPDATGEDGGSPGGGAGPGGSTGQGSGSGAGSGGAGGGSGRRGPPGPGAGRAPPGPGVGSEGAATINDSDDAASRDTLKIKRLTRTLHNINRQIQQLRRKLEEAGAFVPEEAPPEAVDPFNGEQLLIWAHDLAVEAGKTYRYRFTVELYNPFFARNVFLIAEQQPLAQSLTMSSATSEWTEGMEAAPPLEVFITKASAESGVGQLGMGQATAEIYRFSHGRWWVDTDSLEPGDRVGELVPRRGQAGPQAIDFGTGWYVLDIVADLDATSEERDRGWVARVLLQSVEDPSVVVVQDPQEVSRDRDRQRLEDAVDLAEQLGGEFASRN